MVKHAVMLRRYQAGPGERDARATLVKRTDADFVAGLLEGLRQSAPAESMGAPDARQDDFDRLHLFQPIHRTFNLLVVEAACDRPGFPRLDPRSIESAGLVVRRVGRIPPRPSFAKGRIALLRDRVQTSDTALAAQEVLFPSAQGWMVRNGAPIGWAPLADPDLDPDPSRRRRTITANPRINGKLAELLGWAAAPGESVSPLFVAPPDVCQAARSTILYGVVPVASGEASATPELPEITDDDILASTPAFLRALNRSGRPDVNGAVTLDALDQALAADPAGALAGFARDLRLMQFGWGAFDAGDDELLGMLNQIEVRFGDPGVPSPLGDYLKGLCDFAVLRTDTDTTSMSLPDVWPQPDAALAAQIRSAAKRRLTQRLAAVAPPGRRFDDERAVYQARAFVRARCQDGCPPELLWSAPTPPFSIAPWWENGGPLHSISLPDLDSESVKKLKPNVAFTVPASLAGLLQNNGLKNFQDGTANPAPLGVGWICSFSLPAITLCAFIVLNLFLSLFNIIFQWLLFIKICLPFPKPPPPPQR